MSLTVQSVVKNEPMLYYAVKSVYDYASHIMLWDTGSDDAHTLADIQSLLLEDTKNKIDFRQVHIDADDMTWNVKNYKEIRAANKNKRGIGVIRKEMLEATTTPYFMVLDGDEVHYRQTMKRVTETIKNWPDNKVCGFLPMNWYCDPKQVFRYSPVWGRLFKTDAVGMTTQSPGEMHTVKVTGASLSATNPVSFAVEGCLPMAHFETMLRPWRRPVRGPVSAPELPEVMLESPQYLERFMSDPQRKTYKEYFND